jgi:hypothetical protein
MAYSCANLKQNQLYIDNSPSNPTNSFYYSSGEIYHDHITSEAWFTHQDNCLNVKAVEEATYKGDLGMHIVWDRTAEGCPWLGLGFGWDGWTGKNLSAVKNTAALEFWVRMVEGERSNLPWAIGFEDFAGAQAWLGMTTNAIKGENISTTWTRIELPLSEFNWNEQDADESAIKQVIFQMEADGEIYMDEVRIVPYSGGYRKRAQIALLNSHDFKVDGLQDDVIWETEEIQFGKNKVHLAIIDSLLCIALEVEDADPLQNSNTGDKSFDGDAFEIAFSTDANAPHQRVRYLSSDQHISIALGDEITVWNWRKRLNLQEVTTSARKTTNGYIVEAMINLNELNAEPFVIDELYGLEMAVDHGNLSGRISQERWNDSANGGFYENPFLWGEMMLFNSGEVIEQLKP